MLWLVQHVFEQWVVWIGRMFKVGVKFAKSNSSAEEISEGVTPQKVTQTIPPMHIGFVTDYLVPVLQQENATWNDDEDSHADDKAGGPRSGPPVSPHNELFWSSACRNMDEPGLR